MFVLGNIVILEHSEEEKKISAKIQLLILKMLPILSVMYVIGYIYPC